MILSCIGLGTATTRHALRQVTTCTLLAVQEERLETTVKGSTDLAISELFKMGALQIASEVTESSVPDKNISIILQSSIMVKKYKCSVKIFILIYFNIREIRKDLQRRNRTPNANKSLLEMILV